MKRFCLALELHRDPALIAEYIEHHREGRAAIHQSIRDAGVLDMQIFELDGRLCMVMDTADDFSFERKAQLDAANPAVQQWETLMEKFQQVDHATDRASKWRPMQKIFQLR
jgi:L-rhamnose mutarotase